MHKQTYLAYFFAQRPECRYFAIELVHLNDIP
jgi:hypothetical protein